MTAHLAKHLGQNIPHSGFGEDHAFELLEKLIRAESADLGAADAMAHMDPKPASIAAALVGLNAELNQNLLHPDLSPLASEAENLVIDWLAPLFGMVTGHFCSGSTLANLAALWAAREQGAKRVVASADAHLSIRKSAHILGLPLELISVNAQGRMDTADLRELSDCALVLTAGTTGRGVIDLLGLSSGFGVKQPLWIHVDAAWAGPLRLTRYSDRLNGIEQADSVAVSAHKWLFQPKESAFVLFAKPEYQASVSFSGAYLSVPNVGVQGSRSAAAVALLGTLLAWGSDGLDQKIHEAMECADHLASRIDQDLRLELKQRPETGVLNWRVRHHEAEEQDLLTERAIQSLKGTSSRTEIDGRPWARQVSANFDVDIEAVWQRIERVIGQL